MQMKFYSPLAADFFPNEPDYEDEFYDEYEGCPLDGHDLLQYADAVDEAVKKDIADFNGDLMQYYHEDDSVRSKVVSAVPSVEICGNKLCGCLTVELKETLLDDEQTVLCNYISGQYSDGWGEGFEQRDIRVDDGTLAVHFWQEDGFKMTPSFEKIPKPEKNSLRPKMQLIGQDGNIFAIMGRASRLLKNSGQGDKAKEMRDRVMSCDSYQKALNIVSEYAYAGQQLHTYFEKEEIAAKLFRKYPALLKSSADLHQAIMQEQLAPHRAQETEWERQMLRTEVKHYIEVSGLAYSYNKFYAQNAPDKVAWETLQSDLFSNLPQIKAERMPQDFSVVLPKLWRKRQAWDAERTKRPPYRGEER